MNDTPADLDLCAQEPIRIPGGIQPFGALLVLDLAAGTVLQASSNAGDLLGLSVEPGITVDWPSLTNALKAWDEDEQAGFLRFFEKDGTCFLVSAHQGAQGTVVEFEPAEREVLADNPYPRMQGFIDRMDGVDGLEDILREVAREVRSLTRFNRVMIYRFDAEWNGTVIAEDGDGTLPSYLDLRFPASDIPAQARELYRLNRIRLIASSNYEPVPIVPPASPLDGQPLDLSFAGLRSVSPIHLEYMRNMGTGASMSISVVIDGVLWGLISCHNAEPKLVDARTRSACEFLARIVAHQISAHERRVEVAERLTLKRVETDLVSHMARMPIFQEALVDRASQWLRLANADGAAIVTDTMTLTVGRVPTTARIHQLSRWLHGRRVERVFATSHLSTDWEPGHEIGDVASGVLAVPISQIHPSFIFWFRREVVQTVQWGGQPSKPQVDGDMRLHPRKSFETWKEQVRLQAIPWSIAEVHAVADFRQSVLDLVLQRAEERAEMTEELQRSNKELEAFSYSISHDLRAPFRHIAGYAQLLKEEEPELKDLSRHYLEGITQAALTAGQLVDDLLQFSQLGRASLKMARIDMDKIAQEIRRSLSHQTDDRDIEWKIADLPVGYGDPSLIRQAMFNLVDNAVKYTAGRSPATISITGQKTEDGSTHYVVEDNGVGFDMAYVGKLFQVFQRLHHADEFDGTGIGLALTKRIVERHGGSIMAEGTLDKGARFTIVLPDRKGKTESGKLETHPAG